MTIRSRFALLLLLLAPVALGQTAPAASAPAVPKPDSLVAEGVPAIPASLADEVGRYTEFRSASFTGWHPTRREMLITTRFGNVAQAHLVKLPGGARTQMTFSPDRVRSPRFDPTTGDSFIFSRDIGGAEFFQYYRYDFADGSVTLLTDGKSRNTGAQWSNAGNRIAYGSTRRTGDDVDIYVLDIADPRTDRRVLELSGGGWAVADWSPDDSKLLVVEFLSINESYLWLADVATGAKTIAHAPGQDQGRVPGRRLRPRRQEPLRHGRRGVRVPTPGGDGPGDEEARFPHARHGRRRRVRSLPGRDEDRLRDQREGRGGRAPARHRLAARAAGPEAALGTVSEATWHPDGEAVAFTMNTPRSNSDAYSWDVAAGRLDRWTTSELGGLNPETFAEAELVSWKSFDGREISGFLYKPSPAKFPGKRPVVVDIHGGPEGQSQAEFLGRENYLPNELGVAMIFPNVRGSTGYGKTFSQLDNGMLREGTYKDVAALLRLDRGAGRTWTPLASWCRAAATAAT